MSTLDQLPVIIGAAQDSRAVPDDLDKAFGPAELAGAALREAMGGLNSVDVCFGVRLFGDSGPAFPNPFGASNNFPASVCARAGITARSHVYSHVGGQAPQTLVADAARLLMSGEAETVAIVGAEAIANIKAAGKAGASPDWSETRDEPLDDRGLYPPGPFIVSPAAVAHRIAAPMYYYALFETARRHALGKSRDEYRQDMAALWEEFAAIAADNPYATERSGLSGEAIVTPGPRNPVVSTPYTKAMVARDRVNQGAAVVMSTYGHAKTLGITDVTFLHAHNEATDCTPIERDVFHASSAQAAVLRGLAEGADMYDLYSCFPVVPLEAMALIGLARGECPLSLTGGLPFFGGPGNNYSLHAIAEAHARVRGRNLTACVYANGGLASKHAAGLYSGEPPAQVGLRKEERVEPARKIAGENPSGKLLSYTVEHRRGEPSGVLLAGETEDGARFYARAGAERAGEFLESDPLGEEIATRTERGVNQLT